MDKPEKLEAGGEYVWDKITSGFELDIAGYNLLENICRTVDIIARLERKLKAPKHEWTTLVEDAGYKGDDTKIIVVVDQVLVEVRQQRLALRMLWQHLALGNAKPKTVKGQKKNLWTELSELDSKTDWDTTVK